MTESPPYFCQAHDTALTQVRTQMRSVSRALDGWQALNQYLQTWKAKRLGRARITVVN